jgi:hypothetical protein
LLVGYIAKAWPAVFLDSCQVFYALKVSHQILSLLLGSLRANLIRIVNIVDTVNFSVLGTGFTLVREDKAKESREGE